MGKRKVTRPINDEDYYWFKVCIALLIIICLMIVGGGYEYNDMASSMTSDDEVARISEAFMQENHVLSEKMRGTQADFYYCRRELVRCEDPLNGAH